MVDRQIFSGGFFISSSEVASSKTNEEEDKSFETSFLRYESLCFTVFYLSFHPL